MKRTRAYFAVLLVTAVGIGVFMTPSRANTPVTFFSGNVLAKQASNMAVKAFNNTGLAIKVTARVFHLDGTQVTPSDPASQSVRAHHAAIINFLVTGST